MVLFNLDDDRTWMGLLVLGLLLNLIVCFTSDLGLDTHVKMAVDDKGSLPWGDLRPDVAGFSDPTDGGERTVAPIYSSSESTVKGLALCVFFGLIFFVYRSVGIRSAAVFSLSPALIFSIGRGYEEVYFALLFAGSFGLFSGRWSQRVQQTQCLIGGWMLMLIPYAKGMADLTSVLLFGTLLGLIGIGWGVMQRSSSNFLDWTTKPLQAGLVAAGTTSALLVGIGVFDLSSTLGVMGTSPLRYGSAVLLAVIDALGLFVFLGMVLWPFVRPAIHALMSINDGTVATMVAMIVAAATAIVLYIAALWTFESVLWDAAWPGVVWTMGNNGRYMTLLFIPLVVLLKQLNDAAGTPTLDVPKDSIKMVAATLLLLLPLTLLASLHGQSMWTDEASESMNLEPDDHFLLVTEATLGMHWLYTFYEPLDAEANNITGHWRSSDVNWIDDLEQNLPHVTAIVLAPEIKNVPTGWVVESTGEADLLNGGGEWRVLTRT
jgi:hypothetical protein